MGVVKRKLALALALARTIIIDGHLRLETKGPAVQCSGADTGWGVGGGGGAKGAVAPPLQPRSIGLFNTKMSPSPPPAPLLSCSPSSQHFS